MKEHFLAHIASDGREQTVLEHLRGTAELAKQFASAFGAGDLGYLAGISHDLGKYSDAFQKRLYGASAHVDHSTAGAFECMKRRQLAAAFAVMGHHGGLPDGGSQMDTDTTFSGRMMKARARKLPDYSVWERELALPDLPERNGLDKTEYMFFTRMLYSCLVDADYLDTEAFMNGEMRQVVSTDMQQMWRRLQEYMTPWFPPKGAINEHRCAVLQQCIREGETREPGLFTLTVPTGGGKTVASLAFALAQAKEKGLRRVIYVIPYTSIIEQTADVFRQILGEENVLEHHSGSLADVEQEATPEQIRRVAAMENWDAPVIVTTAVQFFESLYAARPSKCRKLHNLAQSVIVFDEAQMMPIPYLQPCVFAISQLVKHYDVSAVLCTATQPALGSIFKEFLPGQPALEICPPGMCSWEGFCRVTFRKAGKMSWDAIAEEMNALPQALCIVNSRKNAQALYEHLEQGGSYHLSTLMCPVHRKRQLAEIRERLKEGLPCRVVSTSLIEAGVDVDFPAVFREEAGLDSILQAAGRCNREGKRDPAQSLVTVFQSESVSPPMFRMTIGAGRETLARYEALDSREAIQWYFNVLLSLKGKDKLDEKQIMTLPDDRPFPFQEIAKRVQLIENETRTIYIPMDAEAERLFDALRQGVRNKKLFRKLGQYGVSVYVQHYTELEQAGALENLGDDAVLLSDMTLYYDKTGLSLHADSGQALFV